TTAKGVLLLVSRIDDDYRVDLYKATSLLQARSASTLLKALLSETQKPWRASGNTSISARTFAASNAARSLSFTSGSRLSSSAAIARYNHAFIFGASKCGLSGLAVAKKPPWKDDPARTRSGNSAAVFSTYAPPKQYPSTPIFLLFFISG